VINIFKKVNKVKVTPIYIFLY